MNQINNFAENHKIHFIGIGGISMSSLAHVLLSRQIKVSGSDSKESGLTKELREKGAEISIGQSADNITDDVTLVVYTAAISDENPELKAAREKGIRCMTRAEFLGLLMKGYKTSICVSGTHGKTTTTSLISQVLLDAEADPTIMVGGILPSINGNTRIGGSDMFLTEACEYTNSFLSFFPTVAVILNVREDHLDFFKDLDDIRKSFRSFAHLLPDDGALVINGEIENLSYFTDGLEAKVITFGLEGNFDFTAGNISYNKYACPEIDIKHSGKKAAHVSLKIPGQHNIYNALAAFAVSHTLGLDAEKSASSLGSFSGVDRRFQIKGQVGGVTIVDDYAHHPDEIGATLSAALNMPHKKLWVVFQPHTYTRTKAFLDDFADKLSLADCVVLADIYAAREVNTIGVSSADILKRLEEKHVESYFFPTFDEIENFLLENCEKDDLLITMGAGDVVLIGDFLLGL